MKMRVAAWPVILAILVLPWLAPRAGAVSDQRTLENIDHYMKAAALISKGEIEPNLERLRQLASAGFTPAEELIHHVELALLDQETNSLTSGTAIYARVREVWRQSELVPPSSVGNDFEFSALLGLP